MWKRSLYHGWSWKLLLKYSLLRLSDYSLPARYHSRHNNIKKNASIANELVVSTLHFFQIQMTQQLLLLYQMNKPCIPKETENLWPSYLHFYLILRDFGILHEILLNVSRWGPSRIALQAVRVYFHEGRLEHASFLLVTLSLPVKEQSQPVNEGLSWCKQTWG